MKSDADSAVKPVDLSSDDGLAPPRRNIAICTISLGTILTTVDGSIVNIALPTLARDLHVQPSEAVLVVTVYQLVLMMSLLPLSALGQRVGNRATYQYGQILFVAAIILCFFVHSLPALVLVRGLAALGAAAVASVSSALIRATYPSLRLGRGLSINTAIAAAAASLAPTLGGAVLAVANWPWLFAMVAPFAVVSILIGRNSLPDSARHPEPYDILGALMCAATFGLGIAGLESAVHGDSLLFSSALIALSIALGTVFVRRELGQALPVLPVDLLRLKTIALPCIGSLLAYLAMMILMVTLPFRLQQHFHFTPAEAGAVLAPMPIMSIIVAPTSGLLSDRIPAGVLGAIGMAFAFVGMITLGFLPTSPTHIDILWRVAVCGFGTGMFFSPNARQVVGAAPAARAAAAGALFSTTRGAGQTLGATAAAALLAGSIGIGPIPPFISAGLALLAGLCCLAVARPATQRP